MQNVLSGAAKPMYKIKYLLSQVVLTRLPCSPGHLADGVNDRLVFIHVGLVTGSCPFKSWIQGASPGHDIVTSPRCPQPGFTLPRRQFVTLNRLRCGQARCAESLHRWGVIASPACPCGESHQTTRHIVEECPLTALPGGLQRLHQAGPDAVEWLSRLSMKQ